MLAGNKPLLKQMFTQQSVGHNELRAKKKKKTLENIASQKTLTNQISIADVDHWLCLLFYLLQIWWLYFFDKVTNINQNFKYVQAFLEESTYAKEINTSTKQFSTHCGLVTPYDNKYM